jgi:hypothetical protein
MFLVRHGLLLMTVAIMALLGSASVNAQTVIDRTSCGHFETWEDAQAALEDPNFPNRETLDPDDDGVACESAFGVGDGDIPADQMACSNFDSREDAQAHFDATTSEGQRDILDPDGNDVACEEAFGVVVDPTSCGHFETQEDAQAILDDPANPNRENLDADGDGIACEDAFGEPETDQETVSRLPSTGTGTAQARHGDPTVAVSLALTAILLASGAAYRRGKVIRA